MPPSDVAPKSLRTETAFDHLDSTQPGEDVDSAYADMRRCPVAHSPRHGGFDYVSRYGDVRAALADTETYASGDGVFIPPSGLPRIAALEFDGPEHATWRAALNPPLTLRSVRALEPVITEVVDGLIDAFARHGAADLVPQLAHPLPAIVMGRIVGLDQEQAVEIRGIADALFAGIGTDGFAHHMAAFTRFTEAILEDRRQHPREDFLSEMARGVIDGVAVDRADLPGLMVVYFLGGHHSTSSGVAGLLRDLLTVPGLRDRLLAEPDLRPRAVEESLRLMTPLQLFARTTTRDTSVGGHDLPAGTRVMLNLAAADLDPDRFEDPTAFRLDRERNQHLAFGGGSHVCPGQNLARAELRLVLDRLLERLPDVQLTGGEVHRRLLGGQLMAIDSLPVAFTPETH